MIAYGAAIALFIAAWWLLYLMRKDTVLRGSLEQENKTKDGVLDDVHTANIVRDKLKSDPDSALGVQQRFERK